MESRHGVRQINMGGGRGENIHPENYDDDGDKIMMIINMGGVGGGEKSHNIHCENYDDGDTNYDDNEGYPAKYHHHKLP